MLTTNEVKSLAESMGADFFGVADLSKTIDSVAMQPGKRVLNYSRAVSIGLKLPHTIVDQLPDRHMPSVAKIYRLQAYDVINQRLDHIASRISSFLELHGKSAFPVPASQIIDNEKLVGVFSNKMAAHLAGLGWIGKSCLLVTPEVGPRVRWATVLTQAPLDKTGEPMDERCGECNDCVDACPVHAFTGRSFREDEDRNTRYNVRKCQDYFDKLTAERGIAVCGICLYVCPHGKRASEKLK